LPDGGGVLSVVHRAKGEADTIVLVRDGSFETLLEHSGEDLLWPLFANGYIVYGRARGTIWAAPFSLETQEVTGPSFLVAESAGFPSVSSDGTLVYARTHASPGQLVWVDRTGAVTEVIGKPQQGLRQPVVSPDNARAAAFATETGAHRIWIHELARGTRRPFSYKGATEVAGWVSDDRLAYRSGSKTYMRSVTRSDPAELLVDDVTKTISSDRRYAATVRRVGESLDIYYFDLQDAGKALPLLVSDATEAGPALRPGGGWLAYVSNETGRREVYLVRFPSGEGKRQVSVNGGTAPHWSRKGDEMFFQTNWGDGADIMFVGVTAEPEWQLTEPKRLFGGADATINIGRGWSVSSDGQRILGIRSVTPESDTRRINVVENWYREFEKP
jgi:Tol biopolymer transport system component